MGFNRIYQSGMIVIYDLDLWSVRDLQRCQTPPPPDLAIYYLLYHLIIVYKGGQVIKPTIVVKKPYKLL